MEAVQHDAPRRSPEGAPTLSARGLTKRWAGRAVIEDLDLTLLSGTVTWLGGRNGTGKTTLLRVLAGLIDPDAGEVTIDGLDPWTRRREYQRRLGYLPAGNGALYARLTVRDNLDFWAGLAMLPRASRAARVDAAIGRFELGSLAGQRVDRLSMGQRQRVRIAMTFLHDPDVMLLDEPHTSLDEDAIGLLDAALGELTARSGCAVWCSPAREGIGIPADRELMLQDARVVEA